MKLAHVCLVNATSEEIGTEFVLLGLSLRLNQAMQFFDQNLSVSLVVHFHDQFLPSGLFHLPIAVVFLEIVYYLSQIFFTLKWVLLTVYLLKDLFEC